MIRAAHRIVERLRRHGHEAFFAGGWVRDFLLQRTAKDIDIATSARPDEVIRLFPRTTPLGAKYGVVQVRMYHRAYEVATFRSDAPYLDGRHPSEVVFSGAEEDALRRDFTINGLFYDPISCKVIDYVSGEADIRKKVLRTIGRSDDRFSEDKLRMLRAIRLACMLDFAIEAKTWSAIRRHSPEILDVSWERIRDELLNIITSPARARGLDLLQESGLLARILPEVEAMRSVPQPIPYHPEGDVYVHTRSALELLRKPSAVLALATLLHDVGKPPTLEIKDRIRFDGHPDVGARMADQICRRLRLSKDDTVQVVDLVADHLRFMHVKEMRKSTLRRFLSKPNFLDHLELHRVDCLSSHRGLDGYRFCRRQLAELKRETPLQPQLITGHDLIRLGYQPGPAFGKILRRIEDLQLEGSIRSSSDALEYIKNRYPLPDDS